MQSRDISEANQEFTDFDKDMQDAAAAMAPATGKLKGMQWKDAIPLEQKALQALLRGEATFRKIEVAFGQRGGGGGGGGNSGRDLASLFDLELDTEKNQYETAQTASPAEQHEKDVEDALAKLDALAKRQEDLANQSHNPQLSFRDRWQQEMLRREAEQLQRQMEQLARNAQQGQQGSSDSGQQNSAPQNSSQSNSQGQSGSQNQSGSQSSRQQDSGQPSDSSSGQSGDQRIEQALNRMHQATDAMKRGDSQQQSEDTARQLPIGCAKLLICSLARNSSLLQAKWARWRTRQAGSHRRSARKLAVSTSSPNNRMIRIPATPTLRISTI